MLEQLKHIQVREQLTDHMMALRLGVARSTWTDIRNGRIPLSPKVQLAAARAFPEVLDELVTSVTVEHAS